MKTVLVIGATGMTGTELIKKLLDTEEYSKVISFVRRATGTTHPKLTEHIVDFDDMANWKYLLKGDVLFSAMGTTLKNAGSKAAQYKIDYTFQYEAAMYAAENGVSTYVLISSVGANANSLNFYQRMKGELDNAVQQLGFNTIVILRPGQLYGNRTEKRSAEKFALQMMFIFNKIGLLKKLRPIHASQLANAMIVAATLNKTSIYTLTEIFDLINESS